MIKESIFDIIKPIIIDPIDLDRVAMDQWRWCAPTSDGWQLVRDENHARSLIDNIDRYWSWLMLEKTSPRTHVVTSIASCKYGLILEASIQTGELARIYKVGLKSTRVISIKEESIPFRRVRSDELFSIREASHICLEWVKEETLDKDFGLRLDDDDLKL
jgi:hypothetical protein